MTTANANGRRLRRACRSKAGSVAATWTGASTTALSFAAVAGLSCRRARRFTANGG